MYPRMLSSVSCLQVEMTLEPAGEPQESFTWTDKHSMNLRTYRTFPDYASSHRYFSHCDQVINKEHVID
jgi:hypothetical protein